MSRGQDEIWGWGTNSKGQLGNGSATHRQQPVQPKGISDIVASIGGGYHTLALRSDGVVLAWGLNETGQPGDGTGTDQLAPVEVSALTDVTAIAGVAITVWRC